MCNALAANKQEVIFDKKVDLASCNRLQCQRNKCVLLQAWKQKENRPGNPRQLRAFPQFLE